MQVRSSEKPYFSAAIFICTAAKVRITQVKVRIFQSKVRKLMKVSSITDTNKRDQNEDNRLIIPKKIKGKKLLFAAVFDGMGGTDAGEVASGLTRDAFENWFFGFGSDELKNFPSSAKEEITELFEDINKKILDYEAETGNSSGSTAAILMIAGDEYIAANLGDSRIYKFGSKNIQITKDQTLAQLEVDKGNLTPEEALTDKRSHTLVQSLGQDYPLEPDFFKGKCRKNDSFLICSDGMYNRVSIEEMTEIVKMKDLSTRDKLLELAILSKEMGEKDNITGILIEV